MQPPASPPTPSTMDEPEGLPAVPVFRRRFSTGEVLGQTFSIFFGSSVPLAVTALILLPFGALSLAIVSSIEDPATAATAQVLLGIVQFLGVSPLATAAIIYAVFQRMRGRDVEAGDAIRVGLSKLGTVLIVAILQGFATMLGLVFCILPGLALAAMYAVAVPVAVEEGQRAGGALNRSSELTEGHQLNVFFVLVLLVLLQGVAETVAANARNFHELLGQILELGIDVVSTGLAATASTVMYYRLRSVKESLDVDQIASVFD